MLPMRVCRMKSYDDMSNKAADIIAAQIILKPDSVLGLATGSSPIGAYQSLVSRYEAGALDFADITSFNLDEYVGLEQTHDQSYRYFMEDNLFSKVNIDSKNVNFLNGMALDAIAECQRYESAIEEKGGIDLQLLGIGHNGHIAFNEPSDAFVKNTFKVELTQRTIEANTRFFASESEVPRFALTMGIGPIMRARSIVVVVSGSDKAEAVRDALSGPITPKVPASILQLHEHVVIVGDEDALSLV